MELRLPLTITIEPDQDAENPCNEDGWKIRPFHNIEYRDSVDPFEYINKKGEIRRKWAKNPTFFLLSCTKHSYDAWSLKGTAHVDAWDTTRYAGCMYWEGDPNDIGDPKKIGDERFAESAASFLEAWEHYVNGSNFLFDIKDADEQEIASSGGCYGSDHLISAIKDNLPRGLTPDDIIIEGDCYGVDASDLFEEVPSGG